MNKTMRKFLIIFAAFAAISNLGAIAETTPAKPLNLRAETNTVNMDMVIKDNFVKAKYASAENRFLQGNVKASHDDFADIVSRAVHDDYVFLKLHHPGKHIPMLYQSDFWSIKYHHSYLLTFFYSPLISFHAIVITVLTSLNLLIIATIFVSSCPSGVSAARRSSVL